MFELEKKCWKEYLQRTEYRRNKAIDWMFIVGLISTIIWVILIAFEPKKIIDGCENNLAAIMVFAILGAIYIIDEFISKKCDWLDKDKENKNIETLKQILHDNHCSINQFQIYFNLIKEKYKNKSDRIENYISIIFTFILSLLFALVNENNKLYNLMEIFWIFITFYCLKQIIAIMRRCILHYDITLILEKTNEQLIYLKQKRNMKDYLKSILKSIKKMIAKNISF